MRIALLLLALTTGCLPRATGEALILHPFRHTVGLSTGVSHTEVAFRTSDGLTLRGWLFPAEGIQKGVIVFLHGHSDNRRMGAEVAKRFAPKGYQVLAYDSRAHGESEGTECTFGFREKEDLSAALDSIGASSAIAIGSSLGASVALQAAPLEPRLKGVVAHAPFADLRTAIADRSALLPSSTIASAIASAEEAAKFRVELVSPVESARSIKIPVLLVHGRQDEQTLPASSWRILDALAGPKEILLVDGAGHNDVLTHAAVWESIERWIKRNE